MQHHRICLLGGTGFVGRHLIAALARQGHSLRVLTRRRDPHRDLLTYPTLELIEADIHDEAVLKRQLAGCDVAINLVAILNEQGNGGRGFQKVHVELPRKLINACRHNDIQRVLHMSALNANAGHAPSYYLRSKGEAENLFSAAHDINATLFRPSIIFGAGDHFFTRFADLLRRTPVVFPLACPNARFAPVYVGDVVEAFVRVLDDPHSHHQIYELCGPKEYAFIELVRYTAQVICAKRHIWGLSDGLSRLQASVMEWVPGKPFSLDNYRSTQLPSVCHNGKWPLTHPPLALEAVVPYYLCHQEEHSNRLQRYRRLARRD